MLKNLINICTGNAFASAVTFCSIIPLVKIYGYDSYGKYFIVQSYSVVISCVLSLAIERSIVFLNKRDRIYSIHFNNLCYKYFLLISFIISLCYSSISIYLFSIVSYLQYVVNLQYDISCGRFKKSKYLISLYSLCLITFQLCLSHLSQGLIYSYIICNFLFSFRKRTFNIRSLNTVNLHIYKRNIRFSLTFLFPVLINRISNQSVGLLFPFFMSSNEFGIFSTVTKILRFPSRVISKNLYLVLAHHYKNINRNFNINVFSKIFIPIFFVGILLYITLFLLIGSNILKSFIDIPLHEHIIYYFLSYILIFSVSPFSSVYGLLSKQYYLNYLYLLKFILLSSSFLINNYIVLNYSLALSFFYLINLVVIYYMLKKNHD